MVVTQVTVTISGGGPYGLRLSDGPDQSVVITKVRKNGRGDEAGLREGDIVQTVNGRRCRGIAAPTVSQWIDGSGQKVTIQVTRDSASTTTTTPAQEKSLETVTVQRAEPDHLDQTDQPVPTRTILRQEPRLEFNEFTVTAPSGVDVLQNPDKSFTMTIGMPIQLTLGQSDEQETKDHVERDAQLQPPEDRSPEDASSARQHMNPKQLERILAEGSGSEPNTPDDLPRPGKKMFVDSAFYDDPQHKYPTVDEQIQLARQVAMSVISPANLKSKGHRMFIKRKERAIRWTTGLTDEEKAELASQMAAGKTGGGDAPNTTDDDPHSPEQLPPHSAPPSTMGMPTSVMFAPKLPKDKDTERLNAMSNEELERMMLLERKTTHTNVSPQVCFSLVDDLRSMKGKGGKLFAKRQARVEKLGAEKPDGQEEGEEVVEPPEEPEHRSRSNTDRSVKSTSGSGQPSNRLKEMIDAPRAAMTPWDAAAQYGSVEKAFQHLENVPGKQRPGQQNLADALQQQQQRRREAGGGVGGGTGAVRPKSTIGGVGMVGTGSEESSSNTEAQRSRIEALGGNPNAVGLASAMMSSLATARTSRGGLRSGRLNT